MTIVGFDVSKNELVGARTDRSTKLKQSFIIKNTKEDIAGFLDTLVADSGLRRLLIAAEATGDYHRALALECLRRHIPFKLMNPILTKRFTRATVRKTKTDLTDALIIAKLAHQGEGSDVTEESFASLKTVTRTGDKVTQMILMLNLMQPRLKLALPNDTELWDFLQTPRASLEDTLARLRKRAKRETDPKLRKLLCSIPGIGDTIASTLIAEIGTINRFHSSKALIAYAGLDPRVRQSGISLRSNTRLTKRGSSFLRRAAYLGAAVARRYDPELKIYFERKRNEGRRYREATVAVARKLLYRVFAVWKRGTPYVRYPQAAT